MEERRLQPRLEPRDRLRDGGLRQPQLSGRLCKGAELDNLRKDGPSLEIRQFDRDDIGNDRIRFTPFISSCTPRILEDMATSPPLEGRHEHD